MKRLHAEPVTGQKQRLAIAIPQGKREHPPKPLDAVLTPLLPCVDNDLGIALGPKDMPQACEFEDEFLIVVDLAVVGNDDAAILIE